MQGSLLIGIVVLAAAGAAVEAKSCSRQSSPAPPRGAGAPGDQVFTTQDGVRFRTEVVFSNLEIPWSLTFVPDGRVFVTERPGRVRALDLGRRSSELLLALDDVMAEGEGGLLGLTIDPAFAQNRLVYLYYTARGSDGRAINRVVRYREAAGRLGERVVLLDNIPASSIHDGGRLRFGPDGLLYITAGDASNQSLAQDLGSLAGKILRINGDGTAPRGNPFGSPIYSYGHRNPQGIDWHPGSGDFWEAEHGQTGNDEINVVDAGVNYGWPRIEGNETLPGMQPPIAFYNPAIAPSGAAFYRGTRFPQFANNLFVATLRGTHLLRLRIDSSSRRIAAQERLLDGQFGRLRDVASGPDGYLYFCTNNRDGRGSPGPEDDRIIRIVPAS